MWLGTQVLSPEADDDEARKGTERRRSSHPLSVNPLDFGTFCSSHPSEPARVLEKGQSPVWRAWSAASFPLKEAHGTRARGEGPTVDGRISAPH